MTEDDYIFAPPAQTALPIHGTEGRFPVRRVFCVGRNYAAHAAEMGHDARENPFFFTKPADALVLCDGSDTSMAYPRLTQDCHHEIELVIAIGKSGQDISAATAMAHIYGAAVGLDLTRRDLQAEAKKKGRPWDWAKAFDHSAPITPITPMDQIPHGLKSGAIWLDVNATRRQSGDLSEMIWGVADIIAFASQSVALAAGDLIYTGTPAGVGPINRGDRLVGAIEGLGTLTLRID